MNYNYYKALDIERNDSDFKINDLLRYINIIRLHLKKSDEYASEKYALIAEAHSVLSHSGLRKIYNNFLDNNQEEVFSKYIGSQFLYLFMYYEHEHDLSDSIIKFSNNIFINEFKTLVLKMASALLSNYDKYGINVLSEKNLFIACLDEEVESHLEKIKRETDPIKFGDIAYGNKIGEIIIFHVRVVWCRTKALLRNETKEMIKEIIKLRIFMGEHFSFHSSVQRFLSDFSHRELSKIFFIDNQERTRKELDSLCKEINEFTKLIFIENTEEEKQWINKLISEEDFYDVNYEKGWEEISNFLVKLESEARIRQRFVRTTEESKSFGTSVTDKIGILFCIFIIIFFIFVFYISCKCKYVSVGVSEKNKETLSNSSNPSNSQRAASFLPVIIAAAARSGCK